MSPIKEKYLSVFIIHLVFWGRYHNNVQDISRTFCCIDHSSDPCNESKPSTSWYPGVLPALANGMPKKWESFQANIPHVCLSNMWVRWPPFKDIVLGLWSIFEHQALVHPDTRPGWSWDTAATTLWQNAMEWMCWSRAGTGDRVFKAIPIPRTSRRLVAVYIIKTWLGSYRMLAVLFWKRS